jgi:predicted SAM-dependent methyltransferase
VRQCAKFLEFYQSVGLLPGGVRRYPIRWSTNSYMPPSPFVANSFDLSYAISVFTHLEDERQFAWRSELHRIAKPGALLILTVNGEHVYQRLSPSEQERLHARGFMFLSAVTGRLKFDGLPDFYQMAYHRREYINREWTKYFQVLCYLDHAVNNHQDAVLLRNR